MIPDGLDQPTRADLDAVGAEGSWAEYRDVGALSSCTWRRKVVQAFAGVRSNVLSAFYAQVFTAGRKVGRREGLRRAQAAIAYRQQGHNTEDLHDVARVGRMGAAELLELAPIGNLAERIVNELQPGAGDEDRRVYLRAAGHILAAWLDLRGPGITGGNDAAQPATGGQRDS